MSAVNIIKIGEIKGAKCNDSSGVTAVNDGEDVSIISLPQSFEDMGNVYLVGFIIAG